MRGFAVAAVYVVSVHGTFTDKYPLLSGVTAYYLD